MDTNENPTDADAFLDFIQENAGEFVTIILDAELTAKEQLERLKIFYAKGGWHLDIPGTGGLFHHLESFDDPEFLLLAIRRSAGPFDIKNVKKTTLWRLLSMWGKRRLTGEALRVAIANNNGNK